jgi:inner membrane transporter RhtA
MSQIETSSLPAKTTPTLSSLINLIPSWLLVVIAIISVQIGAAVAKQLFDIAGPTGVVFLRTLVAGLIFVALWRPKVRGLDRTAYVYIVLYGINIALMMLSFYAAIDLIPLGITVAIAFAGPLIVAVIGSRRRSDLLWIVLAGIGILLLSPFTNEGLEPAGVLLAFLSALTWATYILLSSRINKVMDGNTALTFAMIIASLVSLPIGIGGAVGVLVNPALIFLSIIVGILSSAVPFALEFHALKTMPPRAFGLLVSLEPVVATLIGFIVLQEMLELPDIIGIVLVTIAATATARSVK